MPMLGAERSGGHPLIKLHTPNNLEFLKWRNRFKLVDFAKGVILLCFLAESGCL